MRIAFVITPQMLVTSITNAFELLFAAQQYSIANKERQPLNHQKLELRRVADSLDRVVAPTSLSLSADAVFDKSSYDMVYLPALWRNPRTVVKQNKRLIEWLQTQYADGAIINATGTGVCFLAEAGLLDDKPATTHWHYFEQFARDYPRVQLKRQHFITQADRLYCAASVSALTDLSLHHVHRFFNQTVSQHLAHHFSHDARQPFDKLSFRADENSNHADELVLQAQLWMQNNLNRAAISVRQIASQFGMSQRNFSRRFKKATDTTPNQYLQNKRFAAAKELLKNTNLSIKEVAYRVGYLDVSYFSKLFRYFSALTPKQYRTTVRAKLVSSETTSLPDDSQ